MIEVAAVSICRKTNTKFYEAAALSLPKRTRAWRTGGSSSSGRNCAGIPLSLWVGIHRVAARRDAHWAACIRWNAVSRRACVSLRCTQPALCLFLFLCRSLAPRDPRALPSEKRRTATKPLRGRIYRRCPNSTSPLLCHSISIYFVMRLGQASLSRAHRSQ